MAKRNQKIRVVAMVHVGDRLVDVDQLEPQQRQILAAKITCTWFNEIYRGRAEAFVPGIVEPSREALAGIPLSTVDAEGQMV